MRNSLLVLLTMLCIETNAQFLYSHFTDWHNQYTQCGRNCSTFDILNVNSTGPCPGCRWYRMGTPHKASATDIGMWGDQNIGEGEGVFTNFNFTVGKSYKIRVGVTSSNNQWGRLTFVAASGLVETPSTTNVCCGEPFLIEPSTLGLANAYWSSNGPGGAPGFTPSIEPIASVRPGWFSSGTVEKFIIYSPNNFHSQFAVYADGHPNIGPVQYDVSIDYLYIEELCEAPISYILNTQNILTVDFTPPFNPNTSFHWTMGDNTSHNSSTGFSHTYPAYGTYNACVTLDNNQGQEWQCQGCVGICLNEPEQMDGDGPGNGVVPVVPGPCTTSDFFFFANNENTDVGLSPHGANEPYYTIDWGDGTIQTYTGLAMSSIHTYNLISGMSRTYKVCLETGPECKTCIDVCIASPFESQIILDDRDIEYGTDDMGMKTGPGNDQPGVKGNHENGRRVTNTIDHEKNSITTLSLNIVPNPAVTATKLDVKSDVEQSGQLAVLDITGRVMIESAHDLKAGTNSIPLNITELPKGIYMVELSTNTGKVTHTLMKQ